LEHAISQKGSSFFLKGVPEGDDVLFGQDDIERVWNSQLYLQINAGFYFVQLVHIPGFKDLFLPKEYGLFLGQRVHCAILVSSGRREYPAMSYYIECGNGTVFLGEVFLRKVRFKNLRVPLIEKGRRKK